MSIKTGLIGMVDRWVLVEGKKIYGPSGPFLKKICMI